MVPLPESLALTVLCVPCLLDSRRATLKGQARAVCTRSPRDQTHQAVEYNSVSSLPHSLSTPHLSQLQEDDLEQDLVSGDYSDANQERDQLRRTNRQLRVSESGSLRAVHLSRHKWPGGLVN